MPREWPDELMFLRNRKAVQLETQASLAGKTCVITGATSGVGLAALRRLAAAGARLVMIARNRARAEAVRVDILSFAPGPVDIVLADFSNLDEVRTAAAAILDRYPRIDILINCAGLHATRPTYTQEGYETVFCVNHLASFLLTCLLLDRIIASTPARIIQVNSEGHRFDGLDPDDLNWRKRHYTGLRGYGSSKTAQLLTVWEFADILRGTGVTINAMHPGDVRTRIGSNNGWLYRTFQNLFVRPLLKDPAISGSAIYYLAADPSLEGTSGRFYHLTIEEKPAAHALDRVVGKRIWNLSLQMCGLPPMQVQAAGPGDRMGEEDGDDA